MVAERPSGLSTADDPARIGNEFIGIVENTGSEVTAVKKATWSSPRSPSSDGTCEFCREDQPLLSSPTSDAATQTTILFASTRSMWTERFGNAATAAQPSRFQCHQR